MRNDPGTTNQDDKRRPERGAVDARFNRSSRLTDARSFSRVFKNAKRSRDDHFTVLCSRSRQIEPRLGLAVSKKHCRNASARNRIKRIVRESFRRHRAHLRGLDVVVMNTAATHEANNRTLFASLQRHWKRCTAGGGRRSRA